MKLRHDERIHPTRSQRWTLARFFGCARVVYDDGPRARNSARRGGEPHISDTALRKTVITAARRTGERSWPDERSWPKEAPAGRSGAVAAGPARGLPDGVASRRGVWKGPTTASPKTRGRTGRQAIRLTRDGFALRGNGRLFVAEPGEVAVHRSGTLPSEPSSVAIVEDASGGYFAGFVVEVADRALPEPNREETDTGIDLDLDLGLSCHAVLRGVTGSEDRFAEVLPTSGG